MPPWIRIRTSDFRIDLRVGRLVDVCLSADFSDDPISSDEPRLAADLGRLLRVVGDVEPGSLELNRRRREQLADRAAAVRADVERRIREFLDPLEPVLAGLALDIRKGASIVA